jgi:hypothetical protein
VIERGREKIKVVKRGNLERIQRSKVGLGVRCMGNQGKRKEDYVGKTM